MHRTWAGGVAAALALTLGMTGCGGDDPLTRAELVREAGEICKRANRDTIKTLQDASNKGERQIPQRGPVFAELVTKITEIREAAADDLDALVPPEQMSADYDRFLAARHATVDLLPTAEQAEAGDDPEAEQRGKREGTANRIAQRLKIRC